jgi:IclR family acetate operon transcriptional repressor
MVGAATGKAYLACCSPSVRARILADAPQAFTAARLDSSQLEHEIEMVAARGWAIVDEEWLEGVAQIGAAIVVDGEPVGGVGIGMPAHRLDAAAIAELGSQVKAAAQAISGLLHSKTEFVR